jgi:molecular chaperone GrpE
LGSEDQHPREEKPSKNEASGERLSARHEEAENGAGVTEEVSASESLEAGRSANTDLVMRKAGSEVAEEAEPETEGETQEVGREEALTLSSELENVRKERDEYLENMRRMKAEFDNSRARLEGEHERSVQLASKRLVKKLLPILDNLERALEADWDINEGVEATRDQLVDVLAQEGLSPISSEGQSFDPEVHEALMSQPSDEHEEDTILQTLERGYLLNGELVRPAKVVVSKRV